MTKPEPSYLGDGVYAKVDEYGSLVLTTGSHLDAEADHRIVFDAHEPSVTAKLLLYIQVWMEGIEDARR